jgi:hypothetical protein
MRRRLRHIGTAIAVAIATAALAEAAHAIGTASGTLIQNRATVRWTSGASAQDTTTSTNANNDTTVTAVFGETIPNFDTNTFGVGETTTFTYQIMNNGNATDSFNVNIVDSTLQNGAVAWTIRLFVGGASTTGTGSLPTPLVAADGTFSCSIQIVSNSNPVNSPDGSNMRFYVRVRSESNAAATQYVGDNGTQYSVGGGTTFDTAWARISAANLIIVKTITTVTRGGAASLPTPGATITYEIRMDTNGSGTADSVVIYDTIAANVRADSMSNQSDTLGAPGTTFTSDTGATGWSAQYSTVASPNLAYNSANFLMWNSTAALPAGVTVVRWVRQQVPVTVSNQRFRFRVIIN